MKAGVTAILSLRPDELFNTLSPDMDCDSTLGSFHNAGTQPRATKSVGFKKAIQLKAFQHQSV